MQRQFILWDSEFYTNRDEGGSSDLLTGSIS